MVSLSTRVKLGSEQIFSPESKLAVRKAQPSVPKTLLRASQYSWGSCLILSTGQIGRKSPCFSTFGILNTCLQHSVGWMVILTTTDSVFRKLSSEWWWRGVFGLDKLFLCHLILVQHKI